MSSSTATTTGLIIPRVFSIPPGTPFLPTLASTLLAGKLVPDFHFEGDPLALADVTIFVPTRRAARALRFEFMQLMGGRAAILPTIRPLGEFNEDEALFEATTPENSAALDLAPPIAATERLLLLAVLVRAWKSRLPAEVAARFAEEIMVPASAADAIWLARDLADLMDEVETEGADWARLSELVSGNLAGWWQVTLDFLKIASQHWPLILAEHKRTNPAAHRSALIRFEAQRLQRNPPAGPVIAAGSTGSIPATAELLKIISRLPKGAVVLPGFDATLDAASLAAISAPQPQPALLGHPQYGLLKLIDKIGIARDEITMLGMSSSACRLRNHIVSEALRPADTTQLWPQTRKYFSDTDMAAALEGVSVLEAPNEREEALAIAVALRHAVSTPGKRAALVTGDRSLARRVSTELLRFGISADDSGGTPLANTPPAALLRLAIQAALRPGDPLPLLALVKHPLLTLGQPRSMVRHAAELIELAALRGGTGRPDSADFAKLFEHSLTTKSDGGRPPFWLARFSAGRVKDAIAVTQHLVAALDPLLQLRERADLSVPQLAQASTAALEALGRHEDGSVTALYSGDAGQKLAQVLRDLVAAQSPFTFKAEEWPEVLEALLAPEVVKPRQGSDRAIAIWGALEARLLHVDTLVVGGLNEGVWPRKPESDRFMSRLMKGGLDLEPPERRIGLAAHDFQMAMGAPNVILARALRSGDAPAVPSRWLQRLLTFTGKEQAEIMQRRGEQLLVWAHALDAAPQTHYAPRPCPTPPIVNRPNHFSVTEIETLRRDPYAIYARRILGLRALDPVIRDPGAAERGTLFHAILHRFSLEADPNSPDALEQLLQAGRDCFAQSELPQDVEAVWWPRFETLAANIITWERNRFDVISRHAEARAEKTQVGSTRVTLSGYADRIDLLTGNMADILDYKTGSSPSKAQAHTLLSPQLALEAALLKRGSFRELGARESADLAFIRLRANGKVTPESILKHNKTIRSGAELGEEAWARLEKLLEHYADPAHGYLSRALPFREGETDGDYDHLARVLEWSAGGDGANAGANEGGEE
ncbi:double-strand break repair protein AddB [Aquamicrobium segne]|uniref:Double-strand break repair protein AddB n=1 Tax=Aquamicrobium segne TaxID=469547 RepID=A0ABW0GXD3_9HYPH